MDTASDGHSHYDTTPTATSGLGFGGRAPESGIRSPDREGSPSLQQILPLINADEAGRCGPRDLDIHIAETGL